MTKSPEKVDNYINLCKQKGVCKCNTQNWKDNCMIPCNALLHTYSMSKLQKSERLRLVIPKTEFTGSSCPIIFRFFGKEFMSTSKIPKEKKEGLINFCKYQMGKKLDGLTKFFMTSSIKSLNQHKNVKSVSSKISWTLPSYLKK